MTLDEMVAEFDTLTRCGQAFGKRPDDHERQA